MTNEQDIRWFPLQLQNDRFKSVHDFKVDQSLEHAEEDRKREIETYLTLKS